MVLSEIYWIVTLGDVKYLALFRVKFHESLSLPLLKCILILLELDYIIGDYTVVIKQSDVRVRRDTVTQVIYVGQEQEWPEVRALRHSR